MILASDIGATKTIVAAYSCDEGPRKPLAQESYMTADFDGVPGLLRTFIGKHGYRFSRAVLGVAAPVSAGEARMINLPWVLRENELAAQLGFPVELLNDLHATAYAIPHLGRDDLLVLHEGTAVPGGTIAVIAPGTGLGEAFLTWDGTRYRPHASEGGHADFAPRNLLETELFAYIHARLDHVSYERICSGPGIFNIYSFLRDKGCANEPQSLKEALEEAQDPAPVIVSAAMDLEKRCELCDLAVRIFISVLAAEAGNLALKVKATGGIYIAGGIPPRVLPYLEEEQFLETLQDKGRESFLVAAMPVKVVLNPEAALLGAALAAMEKCRDEGHLPL